MSFNYSLPELTSLKNPDPTYFQQIKKLECEIKAIICVDENVHSKAVCLLLKKFAENYLMPSEYWKELLSKTQQSDLRDIKNLSAYHFFYPGKDDHRSWNTKNDYHEKIISNPRIKFAEIFYANKSQRNYDEKGNLDFLMMSLQYPNCDIDDIWALFESELYTFPPKNMVIIYQKMKNLYFKLKTFEENGNAFEWFNALLEVEDDEFVIHNVEFQLGKDLTNKMLWKLYIKFLEKRDKKLMFQIYSKLCRIFVGQESIKAEYENETKKYGISIVVPWKNPFSFEIYDKTFNFNIYQKSAQKNEPTQKHTESIKCYFTPKNALNQKFPFQHTFVKYIFEAANPDIKQKLQYLCKYFFIQFPILLCYKFETQSFLNKNTPKFNFYQHSIIADPSDIRKINFKKIYISTVFYFYGGNSPGALSEFIRRIVKCDAKFVAIKSQNLSFNELKILIGHGNVEDILLHNVQISDERDKNVLMEEILKLTPKIKKIRLSSHPITTSFFDALICIPFQNKIELINFQNVRGENFDAKVFLEFLIAKVSSKCKIDFIFKFSPGQTLDQMYEAVKTDEIKNGIKLYFGKNEAPEYKCFYTTE